LTVVLLKRLFKPSKPAGRVPPDAFLFVQAATKRKQKMPATAWGSNLAGQVKENIVKISMTYGNFFSAPSLPNGKFKTIVSYPLPTGGLCVAGFKN
jgi:hypothetical protein